MKFAILWLSTNPKVRARKTEKRFYADFYILLLFVVLSPAVFSQPGSFQIRGSVYIQNNASYTSTIVQILKQDRKTVIKMELIDSAGNFVIQTVPQGPFYVMISGPGIDPYLSGQLLLDKDLDLGRIALHPQSMTLKEVSVTANKPVIQQFYDKTVVNVAGSITSVGGTVLDVLAKSPGVTVDKDDNIAMRGRQGVLIVIDGKLIPMTGSELANLLRNMSSNQIDKIDLITNPSAKYDASGNSGIIDIHLKKDTRLGTNGNLTSSYGQGRYEKFNSGISLNNRTAALNVFGSYNFGDRNAYNDLRLMRTFYDQGNLATGGYNETNYLKGSAVSNNIRVGADFTITPKTIIGMVANGQFFDNKLLITNNTIALDKNGTDTSSFITGAHNDTRRGNSSINLNFKTALDTTGRELAADLDYANYARSDQQNYLTRYYNLQNTEDKSPYLLHGDLGGGLNIKSVKSDYSQPVGKIVKLEAGIKSSWVASDNRVNFFDRSNGGNQLDTSKSNHFLYRENINAAYINGSGKWRKVSWQFGLRLENTISHGLQLTNNSSFDRNYIQLFPSGYLGYALNAGNDLGLSLSRRINRPTYNQLNPFKIFLDPTTYLEGNPYLKPETTDSYEFTWTIKQNYIVKIGYSRTYDNIVSVLLPEATDANVVFQEPTNIDLYQYYNFSLSIPVNIGNWLKSANDVVFYYGKYSGMVTNTVLHSSKVAFTITSNNTILLSKDLTAEVTGTYQSGDIYGFANSRPYGAINMGIMTKLFKSKANVKLNATDIFFTNYYRATTQVTGYLEHFTQRNDTRVVTLSFTYRFGNNKLPAARRKSSGVEDEKRRAS